MESVRSAARRIKSAGAGAACLAAAAAFVGAPACADVFEAEAAGFHVKLESGALTQGAEVDTISGSVTIWPVATPGLKWTLRNARLVLPKGLAATGASGPGAKAPVVAVGPGATGGAVAVGEGATGGAVAVGPGAKSGGVAVGTGATGGAVAVGGGAKAGAVAVGDNSRAGVLAVGTGAVGGAVTVRSGFKGTGDFEVSVGPRLVTVRGSDLESLPGATIALKAGEAPFGTCVHAAGPGSRLSAGRLVLAGSLRCGPWTVTASTLTVEGGGFSGGGTLSAWGKSAAMSYAASEGALTGRGQLSGPDTPWTRLPGIEAEYRVEGPKLDLRLQGATVALTFSALKVSARTTAKKPNGTAWAYAEMYPASTRGGGGALADGPFEVAKIPAPPAPFAPCPLPVLPTPADAEKGMRDACEAGARRTLVGQALQRALDVCRSGHPSPPVVPTLPRTISLNLGEVFP